MKITDLPAYKRIKEKFDTGEFQNGTASELPIYSYETSRAEFLTPGHYVNAIQYGKLALCEIPEAYRTRDFFLLALSAVHKDIVEYVKAHIGEKFDRDFFKDHIVSDYYSIEFDENCFEYMPIEYIDEEMVSVAILKAINARYVERRGDFDDWFYSVAKRKPNVLTQDFWTLGARLFATKRCGKNKFLEMTPEEYRTKEYYFAMCLENNTPVMEDIPSEILTTDFLVNLVNDNVRNISSFSEEALERKVPIQNHSEEVKFWQAAIMIDGFMSRYIPLNDERVEFFLNSYDEDSSEYRYGFKDSYERFLKKKNLSMTEV